MATANAVKGIIRSARPQFRSKTDRLVFAIHATCLSAGFRLVDVGENANFEAVGVSADAEEVSPEGWNSNTEQYCFVYLNDDDKKLGVKALVLDDQLLTSFLADGSEPQTLELSIDQYTVEDEDLIKGYRNLDDLVMKVQAVIDNQVKAPVSWKTDKEAAPNVQTQACKPSTRQEEDRDGERLGNLRDPLYVGGPDLYPPGLGHPPGGVFPDYGIPGGPPPLAGGGMHVGPNNPYFRNRVRHPEFGPGSLLPPGGLPPGARWDPIRPPGMEGSLPGDFQPRPGGPRFDPDLAPPGPGRGPDWDSMYG